VANDSNPNFLYHNVTPPGGAPKFESVGLIAGVAVNGEARAQAGMGVDAGDYDGDGRIDLTLTAFAHDRNTIYRNVDGGSFEDASGPAGIATSTFTRMGWGTAFLDADLDGRLDLVVANGHIDETVRNIRGNVGYAQAPLLFLNQGAATFRDVASVAGSGFAQARVGRGLACGDFDRDGDVDLLMTTNNGPAVLFRNDQAAGNRSVRLRLIGTQSNRDAIGATVRIYHGGTSQSRVVRSGSSYLSQSELSLTFGLGGASKADRVVVEWPSGKTDEMTNLPAGKAYVVVEGKGVTP